MLIATYVRRSLVRLSAGWRSPAEQGKAASVRAVPPCSVVGGLDQAFADDLAVAFAYMWRDLAGVMSEFVSWARASGLVTPRSASSYRSSVQRLRGISVWDGAGARVAQWEGGNFGHVHAGEAVGTCLMQYNMHVATLPLFQAQLVDLSGKLAHTHRCALQRVAMSRVSSTTLCRFASTR